MHTKIKIQRWMDEQEIPLIDTKGYVTTTRKGTNSVLRILKFLSGEEEKEEEKLNTFIQHKT
jgi:hypothetical protein